MNKMMLIGMVTAIVASPCIGCGNTVARQLATDTLQTTVLYEKDVNDKVNAEKGFYATQRDNIVRPLFGYVPVDQQDSSSDAAAKENDFSVTESLYYGMIVISTQRDGAILADNLIASSGKSAVSPLFTYIDSGVQQARDSYNALAERQRQLSLHLSSGLTLLDEQSTKLDTVRKHLVTLSQEQTPTAEIQQLIDLGKGVRKILVNNKTSNESGSPVSSSSTGSK